MCSYVNRERLTVISHSGAFWRKYCWAWRHFRPDHQHVLSWL